MNPKIQVKPNSDSYPRKILNSRNTEMTNLYISIQNLF